MGFSQAAFGHRSTLGEAQLSSPNDPSHQNSSSLCSLDGSYSDLRQNDRPNSPCCFVYAGKGVYPSPEVPHRHEVAQNLRGSMFYTVVNNMSTDI